MVVTDGSYTRELHPNICSTAFMFECSKGCVKLVGSSPKHTMSANVYREELLGLMAIHLVLLSVNKINPTLQGLADIFSDCLGALDRVEYLPPHQMHCQWLYRNVYLHDSVSGAIDSQRKEEI